MKTVTSALETHLSGEVTSLATLWRVTRTDGQEYFFTDHDQDITFESNTYKSSVGYTRSAVDSQVGLNVDNLETWGFLDDSALTEQELRAGLFDYAEVRISVVNWKDLSQGELKLRRGRLGEVQYSEVTGTFTTELRGLTQLYSQAMMEPYQPECRADLGDSRCKVPIAPSEVQRNTAYSVGDYVRVATSAGTGTETYDDRIYKCTTAGTTAATEPSYDTTVGNTTTDGTAVFTAEEAWMRAAVVSAVTDNRVFTITVTETRAVDDWFTYGAVKWDTGSNGGLVMEVKGWTQSSAEVQLFQDMPFDVQVGDKLGIWVGCDKRHPTCITKFNNILNYRGEPFVPGQDELLTYPDAR